MSRGSAGCPREWGHANICVMDLNLTASYDATAEETFAIITDATFQEQVFEQIRARSYDVAVDDAGIDLVLRVQWETPPMDMTSVVRRVVGQTLVVAQTKTWHPADIDGTREAEVAGEVAGAPIRLTGRTRLVPNGRSTTQAFDLQIAASVPVVGRSLERLVASAVRSRLLAKFQVAGSWLSGFSLRTVLVVRPLRRATGHGSAERPQI